MNLAMVVLVLVLLSQVSGEASTRVLQLSPSIACLGVFVRPTERSFWGENGAICDLRAKSTKPFQVIAEGPVETTTTQALLFRRLLWSSVLRYQKAHSVRKDTKPFPCKVLITRTRRSRFSLPMANHFCVTRSPRAALGRSNK